MARTRRAYVLKRMVELEYVKPGRGDAGHGRAARPRRAGAPAGQRAVLPRVHPAAARGEARLGPRLQGRTLRLHHAQPGHAADGRAGPARWPADPGRSPGVEGRRQGCRGAACPRRRGHPRRAPDRVHQGAGRRHGLRPQRVQPRRQRPPPAGVRLQALRLPGRPGGRANARRAPRRQPAHLHVQRPHLEPGELRRQVPGPHHAPAVTGGVGQRADGAPRGVGRDRSRRRRRPAPGHPEPPAGEPRARPRRRRRVAARADRRLRRPRKPGGADGARLHPVHHRSAGPADRREHPAGQGRGEPGDGLCAHPDAAGSCRAGHRGQREDAGPPDRREDRAPPTTSRTPGSSATRRRWRRACGSVTIGCARSVRTRPEPRRPSRSGSPSCAR